MQSLRELYNVGRGPSSSHTIAPERAAKLFAQRHPNADGFQVVLYGSLAKTAGATAPTAFLPKRCPGEDGNRLRRADRNAASKHDGTSPRTAAARCWVGCAYTASAAAKSGLRASPTAHRRPFTVSIPMTRSKPTAPSIKYAFRNMSGRKKGSES